MGVEDDNSLERSGSPTGPATDGSWITGAEVGEPVLISDSGASVGFAKHAGWHGHWRRLGRRRGGDLGGGRAPHVFSDGFESGDVSAWSTSTP